MASPIHPDRMTPAECLDEIAQILAAGIMRVRARLRLPRAAPRSSLGSTSRPTEAVMSLPMVDGNAGHDRFDRREGGGPKTPTAALKQMWRDLYGQEPPGFSRSYLVSRLAYRIQELAYGGLKPSTRTKLDALADALDPMAVRQRVLDRPVAGVRLVREWRGTEHTVTVLDDGFEWEGRRYTSLSRIARSITRWNGPAFFGLRSGKR
jgi:Protein of unknown function (DUF2924)